MKCLDTYALMEIAQGNQKFLKYTQEEFLITSETLAEFVWVLLRDKDELTADYWYKRLVDYSVDISVDTLVQAMKFRHRHKERKLSFFDCVGYTYALNENIRFVTGDKEFEKEKNVEFVKC